MNAEPSSKFSFSFTLAALLHILLLSIFMLSMNSLPIPPTTLSTHTLQATLFDEQAVVLQIEHANYLTHIPKPKLTRAEKRRLAREKRAAAQLAAKQQKSLAKSLKSAQIKTKTVLPVVDAILVEPAEKLQTEAEKKAAARERWLKKVAARKKVEQQAQQTPQAPPVEQTLLQALPVVVPANDKKTHPPKKQRPKASPPSVPPQKEVELPTLF